MADWPTEFDAILRRHCQMPSTDTQIDPDTLLTSLGMDSLEVVEFIVSIEDTFDLSIPQELLTPQTFATPATVWTMLAELRAADRTSRRHL
jgi:acyl carrier protein